MGGAVGLIMDKLELEAQRAFAICDGDSDQQINKDEMAFFIRAMGQNPTNADVAKLNDSTTSTRPSSISRRTDRSRWSRPTLRHSLKCGTKKTRGSSPSRI